MSDEYSELEATLTQDMVSHKSCLFELYRESRENYRQIEKFHVYDFLKINELVDKDVKRYCSIIEHASYVSVAYILIDVLSNEWKYGELNEDFERFVTHAGERCLLLLIESFLEDFCNSRDNNQNNEAAIYRILDLRIDLRPVLLLGIASNLIYATFGALRSRKDGTDRREMLRERKISLLEKITDKYKLDISRITENIIRNFFGYDCKRLDDNYRNTRETGKPLGFNEGFAAALMAIRQFDISISESEFSKLVIGALQYNSLASVWKVDNQNVLSVYLADSLVEGCGKQSILDIVCKEVVNTLYRQSHSYYLGNSDGTRAAELYLWMLPDLVARLADKGDCSLANLIFDRGWNDCITALYSWVLPSTPLHVIQLLFYYRVFKLISREGSECANLLEGMPQVCMPNGQWVKVADACVGTIERNCADLQKLKELSSTLYNLVIKKRSCKVGMKADCAAN